MSETRQKKQLIGTVVSDKMEKTIVVEVNRQFKHPQYHKYVQRKKKYMVHDAHGSCSVGDLVMIQESRPISRNKHWRVLKTLRKVEQV